MKIIPKILFLFIAVGWSVNVMCQDAPNSKALVKQGIALHDAGKYDEAIAKYNEAIKLDPSNATAYYEMSYTMYSTGKGKDAIPFLEKAITLNPSNGGAYDILGSIYDDDKQPDKALEYYLQGIKAVPNYQRLYFNAAITYSRKGMYAESEKYAISAIKLDPKHASSQRVYAIATYRENKLGCSLLAWCSFLLMEPQTKRSVEAFKYVKYILNTGIKKTGEKNVTITLSDKDLSSGNIIMPLAVLEATNNSKQPLTAVDSLQLQLTAVFKISATITGDKEDPAVIHYFSKYFEALGNSDNMPAFTKYITLIVYKDENLQWLKDNDSKYNAFTGWLADTKREFL